MEFDLNQSQFYFLRKKYYATYQTTVEYEKRYMEPKMEAYVLMNPIQHHPVLLHDIPPRHSNLSDASMRHILLTGVVACIHRSVFYS